ncbi:hypothetical protein [Streptomyces litmocidini]|uniref:Uncharacterized protein n=1 Tax=Streptomyces litmocidini TaxID=67318 RepID=A0ABW7U5K3_9ACTN
MGLLECVDAGTGIDDGTRTATAALIAMSGDGDRAVTCVRGLGRPMSLGV